MSKSWIKEYASAATADFTGNLAAWVQCVGAGTVVLTNEDGTTFTKHASGGEVYPGSFSALVSTTCAYVLLGNGVAPPPIPALTPQPTPVASVAAMKALASASNGQMFQCAADGSNWRYVSTSVLSDDGGFLVAGATGIGSGAFLRTDRVIDITAAVTYATADAAVLYTVPAGFQLQLDIPYNHVTTSFAGGSSSAIGASSSNSGMSTKGDVLGGSGGDVAATLVSTGAYAKGTVGTKIGTPAATLVGAETLIFDRITSVFTSGVGVYHFPARVLLAPAA